MSYPFSRLHADPKGQVALIKALEKKFFDQGFKKTIYAEEHAAELQAYGDRQTADEILDRGGILR